MKSKINEAFENTDVELWREIKDDYYSPSIHVTKQGKIGINVGGYVIVKSLKEWHNSEKQSRIDTLDEIYKIIRQSSIVDGDTLKYIDTELKKLK